MEPVVCDYLKERSVEPRVSEERLIRMSKAPATAANYPEVFMPASRKASYPPLPSGRKVPQP